MNQKTLPIPIRMNGSTLTRLDKAAKKMGVSRSAVIRFAVVNQLPMIETGTIILNAGEDKTLIRFDEIPVA